MLVKSCFLEGRDANEDRDKENRFARLSYSGIAGSNECCATKISFGPATVKVGLGFIGSALLAYYFGPFWGGVGAVLSDLLKSAVFGVEGGFFPGFILSAIVGVMIYAIFLYQNQLNGGALLLQLY